MESFFQSSTYTFVIDLLNPLVAAISILVSVLLFKQMKRMNSGDFKVTEELKIQTLSFVSLLEGIASKLSILPQLGHDRNIDLKQEYELLCQYAHSASYRIFLSFLSDERALFEANLMILCTELNTASSRSDTGATYDLSNILTSIQKMLECITKNKEVVVQAGSLSYVDMCQRIVSLADVIGIKERVEKIRPMKEAESRKIHAFFEFLISEKNIDDPNLRLFVAVFNEDVEGMKKALNDGARVECTDMELLAKYKEYREEFEKKK